MNEYLKILATSTAIILIGGCGSKIAERLTYDTKEKNAAGTIILSDPKLYFRETLISERNEEVSWINQLLKESEDRAKIQFKPELIREVEQISAMATAIGIKFDPAAALNYDNQAERAAIQQEIDITKLSLQLEQLKKDVALVQQAMSTQTEAVNKELNLLANQSGEELKADAFAATAQLKEAIEKLATSVTTRLDSEAKPISLSKASVTPFDDFRDRSAYRNLLKAARNAAKLDELHDYGNANLVRLNFQATVIPDSNNNDALGVLEVKIKAPSLKNNLAVQNNLYNWLVYINTNKAHRDAKDFKLINRGSGLIQRLLKSHFIILEFDDLELVVPLLNNNKSSYLRPQTIVNKINKLVKETSKLDKVINKLSNDKKYKILNDFCSGQLKENHDTGSVIESILFFNDYQQFEAVAKKVQERFAKPKIANSEHSKIEDAKSELFRLMRSADRCKSLASTEKATTPWKAFTNSKDKSVRVYQIEPREQVQQVSTVARAATNLSLAASLAATAPSTGIGANAITEYKNQSMGKATANERIPSVVSYSQRGSGAFGWVFGPQAVLNTNANVELQQLIKTHDLSADLSVPGWWPYFEITHSSLWAPSPVLIKNMQISSKTQSTSATLLPLYDNLENANKALTKFFTNRSKKVEITSIKGGPIQKCKATSIYFQGDELWRASQIFYRGVIFGKEAIRVAADMSGIFVNFPAKTNYNLEDEATALVVTPIGIAEHKIEIHPDSDCKAKPQTTLSANSLIISKVNPSDFMVPSDVNITVMGKNLNKIHSVHLNGQSGQIKMINAEKMIVAFNKTTTSSVRASDNSKLEFFEKDSKGNPKQPPKIIRVRTQVKSL